MEDLTRHATDPNYARELLQLAREGDADSLNELFKHIYPELKRRARRLMDSDRRGHTFGPSGSELVQRVIEKILAADNQILSAATTEEDLINMLTRRMRYILLDYARARNSQKRPKPAERVAMVDAERWTPSADINPELVIRVDEVLRLLEEMNPLAGRAFEHRYFGGLTNEEAAAAIGLSVAAFRRLLFEGTVYVRSKLGGEDFMQ